MSDHDQHRPNAAAYALGALDEAERAGFEAHLRGCEDCRREVDELLATIDALTPVEPGVAPPPALRDRVLHEARTARRPRKSAERADEESVTAFVAPRRWPLLTLAAAATIAFVIAAQGWQSERGRLLEIEGQLDDAARRIDDLEQVSAQQRRALDALAGSEIVTATLAPTGQAPRVRVFWNRTQGVAVVTAFGLTPPAPGRTYQLWGIDSASGAAPVSLGTFDVDASGGGWLTVSATGTFDLAAVTDEPAGGSPQPTQTPFLVGPFSAD